MASGLYSFCGLSRSCLSPSTNQELAIIADSETLRYDGAIDRSLLILSICFWDK